jgi:hypothetical protein
MSPAKRTSYFCSYTRPLSGARLLSRGSVGRVATGARPRSCLPTAVPVDPWPAAVSLHQRAPLRAADGVMDENALRASAYCSQISEHPNGGELRLREAVVESLAPRVVISELAGGALTQCLGHPGKAFAPRLPWPPGEGRRLQFLAGFGNFDYIEH